MNGISTRRLDNIGEDLPKVIEAFEQFKDDNSMLDRYQQYTLFRNEVLIRFFRYTPDSEAEGGYPLDEYGIPYSALKEQLLPIAKVLAVSEKSELGLVPGDLITVADSVVDRSYNPDYLEYKERQDERPIVKGEHPPVFSYGLDKWVHLKFVADKLCGYQESEDDLTYLVPDPLIRTKITF